MKVVKVVTDSGEVRVLRPSETERFVWQKDDITILCKQCGQPVKPSRRKFCSNRCVSAYHSLAYYYRCKEERDRKWREQREEIIPAFKGNRSG